MTNASTIHSITVYWTEKHWNTYNCGKVGIYVAFTERHVSRLHILMLITYKRWRNTHALLRKLQSTQTISRENRFIEKQLQFLRVWTYPPSNNVLPPLCSVILIISHSKTLDHEKNSGTSPLKILFFIYRRTSSVCKSVSLQKSIYRRGKQNVILSN